MDFVAQGAGGLAMANAGRDDAEPRPAGATIADQTGSFLLAYGIVLALFHRQRTGQGQRVDVSLLGGQISLQGWSITSYYLTGRNPQAGARNERSPLFNFYRAADGWLSITIIDERQWPVPCRIVGRPELPHGPPLPAPEPPQCPAPAAPARPPAALPRQPAATGRGHALRAGVAPTVSSTTNMRSSSF